jgi:hypothetical protein
MLALSSASLSFSPVAPVFNPVGPVLASSRVADVSMFQGLRRAAPKAKTAAPKGKTAAAKAKTATKVVPKAKGKAPAAPKRSMFLDVSGKPYKEVDTFIPAFDEIGVVPPIGRWDPLQIREQGPERYRRFVEMEIKHGRMVRLLSPSPTTPSSLRRILGHAPHPSSQTIL